MARDVRIGWVREGSFPTQRYMSGCVRSKNGCIRSKSGRVRRLNRCSSIVTGRNHRYKHGNFEFQYFFRIEVT